MQYRIIVFITHTHTHKTQNTHFFGENDTTAATATPVSLLPTHNKNEKSWFYYYEEALLSIVSRIEVSFLQTLFH
jgi:hypothetical protein